MSASTTGACATAEECKKKIIVAMIAAREMRDDHLENLKNIAKTTLDVLVSTNSTHWVIIVVTSFVLWFLLRRINGSSPIQ